MPKTPEQILAHIRKLNRLRARRFRAKLKAKKQEQQEARGKYAPNYN